MFALKMRSNTKNKKNIIYSSKLTRRSLCWRFHSTLSITCKLPIAHVDQGHQSVVIWSWTITNSVTETQ